MQRFRIQMDNQMHKYKFASLVVTITTTFATLGAAFAAGYCFVKGPLRQLWEVPITNRNAMVVDSIKAMGLACLIYIVSFLIFIIPRGPRSSWEITSGSMAWFIVCSVPQMLFIPYGTFVSLVAMVWIVLVRRAQQRRLKESCYWELVDAS